VFTSLNEEVILNSRCFSILAGLVGVFIAVPLATAQTPANVVVALGNGQLVCASNCTAPPPTFPQPMFAVVTDASGNPIPNYPVTWNVVSGPIQIGTGSSLSTNTDATGTTIVTSFLTSNIFGGTPYVSATLTVTAGSVTTTFTLTNAVAINGLTQVQVDYSQGLQQGSTLSGTAGSTGTPFTIRVYSLVSSSGGNGVPNVSIRLINDDGSSGPSPNIQSAYCQTGPGADPWSVLTDANGLATCTPVFGPIGGSTHQVAVLVGGIPAGIWSVPGTPSGTLFNPGGVQYNPGTFQPLIGFSLTGFVNLNVKAAAIGSIVATSGNNQSANPGQALASPLVATLKDTSGNPLAGQSVTWSASPAAAATLSSTTSVTNSNGQASTNVTFSSSANGPVTIKVSSVSTPNISTTFTVTAVPPVVVTSLTKVGGDNQSALVGTQFGTPLQVQVAVSTGSVANVPVSWSVSGPATLSTASTPTNASGIAQVTVTAGSSAGNVAVTATAGTASQTFNLVVAPPVVFTASNFENGADQQRGSISPCGLATLAAPVAPAVAGTVNAPLVGALPLTLAGVTIAFNSTDYAPILSVSANAVNFLVPCDLTAGSVPVTVQAGGSTGTVTLTLLGAAPGIFSTVQSDGVSRAVILRPDGTFVSLSNPARRGEFVTAFVTGLGPVSPTVATNALPIPGTPSTVNAEVIVGINNAGTIVQSAALSPDRQGVYLINFQIPQGAPQDNNVVFSVGVIPVGSSAPNYSTGSKIPVQ
jgi:uncharacterized protein (TIGR03437 family)